jgi:Putative peptidoglycan binding domain
MTALKMGDSGPEVAAWKRTLIAAGYHLDSDDDRFCADTDVATRSFQRAHGLTVDGLVGPLTLAAAGGPPSRSAGQQVEKVGTPLSRIGIVSALTAGHVALFGVEPSRPRLRIGWSHIAHENRIGDAIWNNNFSNISAFSWSGDFYVIRVQERVSRDPDVWKWVNMRFRAYADSTAGAKDYWHVMSTTFAGALARFDAGDPAGAAQALSRERFFTAPEAPYEMDLVRLCREFPG